mmetsp:Transcript_3376/g.6675  ORF Transcript_3376/g.6675 Transcript_3376/m.6675 type:complete len:320 (-) Transcript_3376:107-1066(-)
MRFMHSLYTLGAWWVHNSAETHHCEPRLAVIHDKLRTELVFSKTLFDGASSQRKYSETVRTKNCNLLNPIVCVTRLKMCLADSTALGLKLTKRDQSIRGSFGVDNEFIHVICGIICVDRHMDSRHELVFRTERNFGNNRSTLFHFDSVNAPKVGSTEDRKFRRISNFAVTPPSFAEDTFATQNTSTKSSTKKGLVRRLSSSVLFRFHGLFYNHWLTQVFDLVYMCFIKWISIVFIIIVVVFGSSKTNGGNPKGKTLGSPTVTFTICTRSTGNDVLSFDVFCVTCSGRHIVRISHKIGRRTLRGVHIKSIPCVGGYKGRQ